MVSTRRARILIVMAWAFIVCVVFVGYKRTQQNRDVSEFLGTMDEKTRLDPEINKDATNAGTDPGGTNHGGTGAKDLSTEPGESFNPEKELAVLLNETPILIFSKSYCPHSKAVKDLLLSEYQINPQPMVVELDAHPHGRELQDYLGTLTGRRTVPNVMVGGVSRGGGDEFRALHASGELAESMQEWGGSMFRIKKLSPKPGSGPGS
uniref:ARAD1C07502p n=1 Tax=Blastobotrys adeninivorans TaxID=409370 RepID=A0A060T0G4_BLAAD